MSVVAAAVVGSALVGGVVSTKAAKSAASSQTAASKTAADAQVQSNQAAIDAAKEQFAQIRQLLSPYTSAGHVAIKAQRSLLGLNGEQQQAQAIENIKSGPLYQQLLESGNENILSNAAATGSLRGGNTQAALMQYAPTLLNQLTQQQLGNYGALASLGENAAAGVGNAGMSMSGQVQNALIGAGNAQANAALIGGQASAMSAINQANAFQNTLGSITAFLTKGAPL